MNSQEKTSRISQQETASCIVALINQNAHCKLHNMNFFYKKRSDMTDCFLVHFKIKIKHNRWQRPSNLKHIFSVKLTTFVFFILYSGLGLSKIWYVPLHFYLFQCYRQFFDGFLSNVVGAPWHSQISPYIPGTEILPCDSFFNKIIVGLMYIKNTLEIKTWTIKTAVKAAVFCPFSKPACKNKAKDLKNGGFDRDSVAKYVM